MAAIARMNAQLTATSGGFAAGLKQGEKALSSFKSTFAGVALATAAYDIGKTAIRGAYNATVGLVSASIESIGALHDQAAAIGISTEALSGLQYAARQSGVDAEALGASLTKMNRNLAEAVSGSGPAADALAGLGLNAQQLANMAPEKAFGLIADKIAAIENPAQRTQAAIDVLGKQGAALIPVMMEGSGALEAAAARAQLFGQSISQVDANKVDEAGDKMGEVGGIITGIGNTLAVGLAPYITAAADAFMGLVEAGGGVGPIVGSAMEWATKSVAYLSDYVSLLQAAWQTLRGVVLSVAAGIVYALDGVGQGVVWLLNLLPGVDIQFESMGGVADQFAKDAVEAFDAAGQAVSDFSSGKNSAAVGAFFDKAADEAAKRAAEAGGAKTGAFIPGGDEDDAAMKTADKTAKEAEAAARRYFESTRTAAEKYAAELERINALQASGALDADTAQRARDQAQRALDDANKTTEPAGASGKASDGPDAPKLLQAGSAAAASFVAQVSKQQRGDGEQKAVVKNTTTANKYLKQIAERDTGSGTTVTVVQF